ncbi:MAG: acylneuraminate cytidylyltransferase family protein [Elusimicrobia bacterium]|nr:acylneuraminate cytidylyltransferase family protein [Elusimicrobiota bacterium]
MLAVIPARGGSKGIPGKNIKPIAGKPLLAWTIEHALAAKSLDRIVVSTEDPKIAAVARKWGAEVLARPRALATDRADTLPVLQHALRACPADVLVVLQCTSPIRSKGLIDRCVAKFLKTKADSLGSVHHDHSYEYGVEMPRRQEIAPRLIDNGSVYVNKAALVLKGDRIGRRFTTLETSRAEGFEIDEPFDFWLCEKILSDRELAINLK